ncbi:MAG: MarC family protein, partial [Deltaproteobacteria bacterium]|nr:MarC family protein [Deltaproteobacteria bacterium]
MDPVGNLPFFLLFTDHCTRREQIRIAAEAAFASAVILILFVWGGDAILNFFDISIPAFQIAGGFIFFLYALQM